MRPPVFDSARLPARQERRWLSATTSAVLHGLIVLTIVGLTHKKEEAAKTAPPPRPTAPPIQMVYLPPEEPKPAPRAPQLPAPIAPTPEPRPEPPRPEATEQEPEPDANAPADAERSEGTADPASGASSGETTAEQPGEEGTAPPTDLASADAMVSEAQRLFGPKAKAIDPTNGPLNIRPFSVQPGTAQPCVPIRRTPDSTGAAPQVGTAVGRIFRQGSRRPLGGAHLQMIGTPYTAFTDPDGKYVFKFDLSLIDNCRTQYVRVTAPGYQSRLLVLIVGENVQSEDVTLRRN